MIRLKRKRAKFSATQGIKTASYPSGSVVGFGCAFLLEELGISLGREMKPQNGVNLREPLGPQDTFY